MPPIAHLDMDAFYVSVELARHPELRGRPVVVAGSGPRAVVTTASYEARRFGVGSATPASRARRLCLDAVFLTPDFPAYREVSRRVMGLVREHVEAVEVVGLDEAYLDLGDLVAPRAAMRRLVAAIRAETGLGASVGIGPNKLVAKVASDAEKPGGFVVLSREQACARFAAAPPGLVPGIGPKTVARLEALGVRTLGELAATPEATLRAHFGPNHARELRRPRAPGRRRAAHARARGGVRIARDDVPRRRRRPGRARARPGSPGRRAVRRPGPSRAPRAHDRDQGPPRRLDNDHPRAHAARGDERRRAGARGRRRAAARVRPAAARAPAGRPGGGLRGGPHGHGGRRAAGAPALARPARGPAIGVRCATSSVSARTAALPGARPA